MYKKFEIKNIISNFTGQNVNVKLKTNMELKKYPKVDAENKKLLFLEIGLVISLGITLLAFGYTTSKMNKSLLEDNQIADEVEEVMITEPLDTPPPPPVEVPEIAFSDQIDIVDDDIEVEDIIIESEDDEDFEITIMDYQEEVVEEVVEEEAIPFQLVEEKPSFQGGDANQFSKWVNQRLVYPEIAKENGVQGRVTLQFTVEKDGSITKVKVLRGVDPSLDKEAVRVVSMSPKWKPGKQRDRAVPVTYTFPVIFQLR